MVDDPLEHEDVVRRPAAVEQPPSVDGRVGRLGRPLHQRQRRVALGEVAPERRIPDEHVGERANDERLLLVEDVVDEAAAAATQHDGAEARLERSGERGDGRAHRVPHQRELARVELCLRLAEARACRRVDGERVEDVRREDELDGALADVVADGAGVRDVEDEEVLLVRVARRVSQAAERPVDADAREPGARELKRGPGAGCRRGLPRRRLHAAIDERAITARTGTREHHRGESVRRHGRARQRHEDRRRLQLLHDRFALRIELPLPPSEKYGGTPDW